MPIIRSMMQNMMKEYGDKKGKSVYYATENKLRSKGKFGKMLAQAKKHHDIQTKA